MSLSVAAALVAIGVAVASALAVGLLPVRGLLRTEPGKALQEYGARHTAAKGVARFRAALATGQVALSMALLAMTGIFAQSLANIARLDLGADLDSVVTFSVALPTSFLIDGSSRARLAEALEAIPGVSSVASSAEPLLSPAGSSQGWATVEGVEGVESERLPVSGNWVSPEFFRTFGIELLAGREFNDTDTMQTAVIVNQRLAERYGLAPAAMIGRRIDLGLAMVEVTGVVADVRSGKVTSEIEPQLFQPLGQQGSVTDATFYVRGARPPEDLLNAVRETAARVDPTRPLTNLQTMEQQLRENIAIERFVAGASTSFAVLAIVLAALGLYGVLAYSVAQRSREIGLRFALGAPVGRIRGMVLRQVVGMAVIGIVLGAAAAWLLGRAARSLLFGVEAGNPLVLAAAAAVLTAVTFGAAYIPARRASRVDPMSVLRYE